MTNPQTGAALSLSERTRSDMVHEKVTCPFLGSAVATGLLAVRNDSQNPLASVDDVTQLGNSGGGDLRDVLVVFAMGNHAQMKGPSGRLDQPVPPGLFSLELPGSQGSHAGHSGILERDPNVLGSGRLSEADFNRFMAHAKDGMLKRSDVGRFIAENLKRDPNSKVFSGSVVRLLAHDLELFVESTGPLLMSKLHGDDAQRSAAQTETYEKLTKLLGEDNLVGSAGEFGLLLAFLASKPGAKEVDDEPAISIDDVHAMFVEKRLPGGWQTWKKTKLDWVRSTTALIISAGREYLRLSREG